MQKSSSIYADGSYLAKNPTWHEEDSAWKAAHIVGLLKNYDLEPRTVAEIGCGTGGVLLELVAKLGSNVQGFGYEISPQAYALAKPRETDQVRFFCDTPLTELVGSVDLVLVIDVIEHLEDYFTFLREVRPIGRYKVFHIPLDLSAQAVCRGKPLMKWRDDVGHIHYFIKDTALAALEETGYRILGHFYTNTALDLPNRGWRAQLLRFPRRLLFRLNADLAVRSLGGFSLMVLAE